MIINEKNIESIEKHVFKLMRTKFVSNSIARILKRQKMLKTCF